LHRGILNWGKPLGINFYINRENSSFPSGVTHRITLGKGGAGGTLTTRGIGVDIAAANTYIKILAHNGTTLTTTDSTYLISNINQSAVARQSCVLSYGNGTVELFVDGTSYGTTSGGPTTVGTNTPNRFSLENYGDGTQSGANSIVYYHAKIIAAV